MDILIAESQSRVRYALTILIQKEAGWHVLGWAVHCRELLSRLPTLDPDVLLLDWNLPGMEADQLLPEIFRIKNGLQVVMMSADPGVRQTALALGVSHFVSKMDPPDRLVELLKLCSKPHPQNEYQA